jgi:hypothetical protein
VSRVAPPDRLWEGSRIGMPPCVEDPRACAALAEGPLADPECASECRACVWPCEPILLPASCWRCGRSRGRLWPRPLRSVTIEELRPPRLLPRWKRPTWASSAPGWPLHAWARKGPWGPRFGGAEPPPRPRPSEPNRRSRSDPCLSCRRRDTRPKCSQSRRRRHKACARASSGHRASEALARQTRLHRARKCICRGTDPLSDRACGRAQVGLAVTASLW